MNDHSFVSMKLYKNEQIWSVGCSLTTPELDTHLNMESGLKRGLKS